MNTITKYTLGWDWTRSCRMLAMFWVKVYLTRLSDDCAEYFRRLVISYRQKCLTLKQIFPYSGLETASLNHGYVVFFFFRKDVFCSKPVGPIYVGEINKRFFFLPSCFSASPFFQASFHRILTLFPFSSLHFFSAPNLVPFITFLSHLLQYPGPHIYRFRVWTTDYTIIIQRACAVMHNTLLVYFLV